MQGHRATGWKKVFIWLFLGKSDVNSSFSALPIEILFHFVNVTKCLYNPN
jgi:hypothetical protein